MPVFQQLLSYLIMVPENTGSEANHLDIPKRSHKGFFFFLNEEVKVLDLLRKEKKNPVLRLLRSMAGTNLLSVIL